MQCMLGSTIPVGCLLNMAGNLLVEPCGDGGDGWRRMIEDLDVMGGGVPPSALAVLGKVMLRRLPMSMDYLWSGAKGAVVTSAFPS